MKVYPFSINGIITSAWALICILISMRSKGERLASEDCTISASKVSNSGNISNIIDSISAVQIWKEIARIIINKPSMRYIDSRDVFHVSYWKK
jgi:hypothetical protein